MILHVLIVDDEEDVLESLVPGFVGDLARRLAKDPELGRVNKEAGSPLPDSGRINVRVTASGYQSAKVEEFAYLSPVHLRLHLCCEKGGSFRHALRLLREQFFAVVVSDLRFSDDLAGARAGRLFIDDVARRNPETFGVLYSAYQKPEGFPDDRFVRKGSASNLRGEQLLEKIVEGVVEYLRAPAIRRLGVELGRRGLVYQSDSFGATLRRLYDYAGLYFSDESVNEENRRRPRPTLLIDGETGTGKTELAGLLHRLSGRREEPFLSATCSQLSDENLLRSTLFGHVKGSFSGAAGDRPGLVQSTGKGILLLDDLHKLTDGGSLILHSFLDDGEYSHVGEDEIRRSAELAIAAAVETPRWEEIKAEDSLPESFINRVEQLVVRVPPLRARPEDIELQASVHCARQGRQIGAEMELSPEALEWLKDHGFPGGNSRKIRDFLKGVVAAHARVTDYLDVAELEEYAAETGILRPQGRIEKSIQVPAAAAVDAGGANWPPEGGSGSWSLRIASLAVQALADQYELDGEAANSLCRDLFEKKFPQLWQEFETLVQLADPVRRMDIKLFDELVRYYAVYLAGSPAKAAKLLGMKDNALREFIYSREQKRGIGKA